MNWYYIRIHGTECTSWYHISFSSEIMLKYILTLTLLLSSCSILPGTQTEVQDNATIYTGSGFSIQVPDAWKTNTGVTLSTPKSGTIELALVSPDIRYGFSNNLVIMKDALNGIISSKKYSELNAAQSQKNYLEYTKIQNDPILFGDTDESRVIVFEAKYNPSTPRLKFIQTAKVCGTNVFLIHFSIALDKSPDAYIALAKTFQCK